MCMCVCVCVCELVRESVHGKMIMLFTGSQPHHVILTAAGAGRGQADVDGAIAAQSALLLLAHHHSPTERGHIRSHYITVDHMTA